METSGNHEQGQEESLGSFISVQDRVARAQVGLEARRALCWALTEPSVAMHGGGVGAGGGWISRIKSGGRKVTQTKMVLRQTVPVRKQNFRLGRWLHGSLVTQAGVGVQSPRTQFLKKKVAQPCNPSSG